MASFIENKTLNNGTTIPVLGLGTYNEERKEVLEVAIRAAVKAGVRHFDLAYIYNNEPIIGKTLREEIAASNGALTRSDFFITSKLWNAFHSKESVKKAIQATLDNLGFDYVDLYLIHWPMGFAENVGLTSKTDENGKFIASDIHYVETYSAMEELVALGKVKSIGVSNFNILQLKDILAMCTIKPVCNQVEVHPLLPNKALVDFCNKENIVVVAYAPLGAPNLINPGDPAPLQNPVVLELAKKHNKTAPQIVLRWLIQRGIVVIPKSVTPSRIEENTKIFDFKLSDEEMQMFNLQNQFRIYKFEMCNNHKLYPFNE